MNASLRGGLFCLLVVHPVAFAACGRHETLRKPTYELKGQVFIDGKPAENVSVFCREVGGMDTEHPTVSAALTDEDGRFTISTYESADGVPEGEYVLDFEWRDYTPFTGSYDGPDKLMGRYKNGEALKGRSVVVKGAPVDMRQIDLESE